MKFKALVEKKNVAALEPFAVIEEVNTHVENSKNIEKMKEFISNL